LGSLLQNCLKVARKKVDCENFSIHIGLGKISGPFQNDLTELEIHLIPFREGSLNYKDPKRRIREHIRIAEKLRDADNQPKKSKQRESI
jgi:hypothetical protein